ncbi:MAG: FdtA/QdtA family cupin domain-containing protein [Planctomycetota bacterium]
MDSHVEPLSGVELIQLPRIHDPRGDLTPIEGGIHVPFNIARVYYLYNVPVDAERGGHAHRQCEKVMFALSGSFRVAIDNGQSRSSFWLRDPRQGLYLDRMVWREMDSFSQGAVLMVVASRPFEEADYIRNYTDFVAALDMSPP